MNMPGFTAESSLYNMRGSYYKATTVTQTRAVIHPAYTLVMGAGVLRSLFCLNRCVLDCPIDESGRHEHYCVSDCLKECGIPLGTVLTTHI